MKINYMMCEKVEVDTWGSVERDDITWSAVLNDGDTKIVITASLNSPDHPIPLHAGNIYRVEVT